MFKFLVTIIFSFICCCQCNKFPPGIPKCRIGDTECIKSTTNIVLSQFNLGEPRIALAQMDPLRINQMKIKQGGNSPVNIELKFHNVELIGLKHFTVTHVKGFGENPEGKYEMRLNGPKLVLKGPYDISGQILILPIQGKGNSTFVLDNPELLVKWTGKTHAKHNKVHLYTDDLRLTFKITRMQAHFGNLFNGNKALGETTNRFLNENWQGIFDEIKEPLFDSFSLITKTMLNDMWSHHDYKHLFLHA